MSQSKCFVGHKAYIKASVYIFGNAISTKTIKRETNDLFIDMFSVGLCVMSRASRTE